MKPRMCEECKWGHHERCLGTVIAPAGARVPCPCYRCAPPKPAERCPSCGKPINAATGECAGCSD